MAESEQLGRYEIRVRGVMSEALLAAFPTCEARFQDGDTVLVGNRSDQSALYGVLAQIEALGLELVEVRHVPT
jgi:hypothetical protein